MTKYSDIHDESFELPERLPGFRPSTEPPITHRLTTIRLKWWKPDFIHECICGQRFLDRDSGRQHLFAMAAAGERIHG